MRIQDLSKSFTALPTWQAVLVATAGAMTIFTSLYLLRRGYVAPIASVLAVTFLIYLSFIRVKKSIDSRPPPTADDGTGYSQFDVFRQMEPADQTRVNPWMGFLQEDVYANRTGPIGTFVGNDDYVRNAPLYPINDTDLMISDTSVQTGSCPSNNCKCYPSPDVPGKTVCGYTDNGILIKCPPDCCPDDCDL
jgi:hypothetical protein